MKTIFTALVSLILLFTSASQADSVGVTIGSPTFVHYTVDLNPNMLEMGLSFEYDHANHAYADYKKRFHDIFNNPHLKDLSLLYGAGGVVAITNKDRADKSGLYGKKSGSLGLGVRLPLALEWNPNHLKELGISVNLNPVIAIVPKTSLEFMAGIGFKYYF
ncbi:MAG: BAPKO_0422 family outer member beta-barrel protein [Pseudobdellovibrio sp.]